MTGSPRIFPVPDRLPFTAISCWDLTAEIHQNNVRSDLFNITKRNAEFFPAAEEIHDSRLFRHNDFTDAALALVKFQIHHMT